MKSYPRSTEVATHDLLPYSSPVSRPSLADFKQLLATESHEVLVREHVFGGDPFAFDAWPYGWILLRKHLADALRVVDSDITLVGSGKLGFSLSPDTFGRQFSDESDVDVIVVSADRFDAAWRALLEWHFPRRNEYSGEMQVWARERRRDVFLGRFEPERLLPTGSVFREPPEFIRDLSASWFNMFQGLGLIDARFASRKYVGRLYRTWDHALLYHAEGLREIRVRIERR